MTLKEFLLEIKTGYNDYVVTSADDESYGVDNYEEGKYFPVNENVWFADDEDDLMEYFEDYPEVFLDDWMNRRVVEIDHLHDLIEWRKWALNMNSEPPRDVVNICIAYTDDDADIWENEELIQDRHIVNGRFPYALMDDDGVPEDDIEDEKLEALKRESWPYEMVVKYPKYHAMMELIKEHGKSNVGNAIGNIIMKGFENIRELDEEFFLNLDEVEKQKDEEYRKEYEEWKVKYEAWKNDPNKSKSFTGMYKNRPNAGYTPYIYRLMKEIADILEDVETLLFFFKICPEYQIVTF